MRAVVFERFGEPAEVLAIRDVPLPTPGPGQVRVRMLACPINPSDLMTIRGTYGRLPSLPAVPGYEGVGIVDAAGSGLLGKFLRGKRVAVINSESGNWAEYAVIPAKQAVPLSSSLTLEQAATFFVNPATAWIMTRKVLRVPKGGWLLQTAAASVLGRMVIRLGKQYGFRTINVVRRKEHAKELTALGGDAIVHFDPAHSTREQFHADVMRLTGGNGVRYAIDPVGGATGSDIIGCLARDARMLVFGTLSDEPLNFSSRDLMVPGATIEGFWLGNWMEHQSLPAKLKLMREITRHIREGALSAEMGQTFPLDEFKNAVAESEKPARGGKTLLKIADP